VDDIVGVCLRGVPATLDEIMTDGRARTEALYERLGGPLSATDRTWVHRLLKAVRIAVDG
jgi:hypothetical protein